MKDTRLSDFLHDTLRNYDLDRYAIEGFGEDLERFLASAWRPASEPPELRLNGWGPRLSEKVLGIDKDGQQAVCYAQRYEPDEGDEDYGIDWYISGPDGYLFFPTHWRPLPEGPK